MSHVCINCGSDKVERNGDDFTCLKCQFHWDVALEQANKVYLRSQGRQPATSVLAVTPNVGDGTLTATEPIQPPSNPSPSGETVPDAAPTATRQPSGKPNKANN